MIAKQLFIFLFELLQQATAGFVLYSETGMLTPHTMDHVPRITLPMRCWNSSDKVLSWLLAFSALTDEEIRSIDPDDKAFIRAKHLSTRFCKLVSNLDILRIKRHLRRQGITAETMSTLGRASTWKTVSSLSESIRDTIARRSAKVSVQDTTGVSGGGGGGDDDLASAAAAHAGPKAKGRWASKGSLRLTGGPEKEQGETRVGGGGSTKDLVAFVTGTLRGTSRRGEADLGGGVTQTLFSTVTWRKTRENYDSTDRLPVPEKEQSKLELTSSIRGGGGGGAAAGAGSATTDQSTTPSLMGSNRLLNEGKASERIRWSCEE